MHLNPLISTRSWGGFAIRPIYFHLAPQKLYTVHFIDSTLGIGTFVEFDESIQQAVTVASSLNLKTGDCSTVLEGFSEIEFGAKER